MIRHDRLQKADLDAVGKGGGGGGGEERLMAILVLQNKIIGWVNINALPTDHASDHTSSTLFEK